MASQAFERMHNTLSNMSKTPTVPYSLELLLISCCFTDPIVDVGMDVPASLVNRAQIAAEEAARVQQLKVC